MKLSLIVESRVVRWVRPDLQQERDELIRTAEEFGINPKAIMSAAAVGDMVRLTDPVWSKLQNTDSWETNSLESVHALAGEYGRDAQRVVDGIKAGATIPAPIVLRHNGYYLIGGNTRLMAARALDVQPTVLMVTLRGTP